MKYLKGAGFEKGRLYIYIYIHMPLMNKNFNEINEQKISFSVS